MRLSSVLILVVAALAVLVSASSCKKEKFLNSGGELRFSADTLSFDTVFTAQGSFTLGVKIFNPQNQKINISSIRVANGSSSFFHLNVNGVPGNAVQNVEIAANDSIYVFATVNIDPGNDNNPFLVEDKLVATLNGNEFSIPLRAYGQNAYYIRDSVLPTQTWQTDKPYVVIGYGLVEEGQTLTIPAGARIYLNADARMFIQGTLIAEGTKTDSIIFQGARLDRGYFGYEGYPGEWGGLYFDSRSTGNRLRHVILANCGNGAQGALQAAIQVNMDSVTDAEPQLYLDRVTVANSIGYGVISFGGDLKMDNCLVHSCGAQALAMFQGGSGEFNNCDFIIHNPQKLTHADNPTMGLLNYLELSPGNLITNPLAAVFRNCVIYGSLDEELVYDKVNNVGFNVQMQNCLIKATQADIVSGITCSNCLFNINPELENTAKYDFHPKSTSPLKNAGLPVAGITVDLDDVPRSGGSVEDIGCYRVP